MLEDWLDNVPQLAINVCQQWEIPYRQIFEALGPAYRSLEPEEFADFFAEQCTPLEMQPQCFHLNTSLLFAQIWATRINAEAFNIDISAEITAYLNMELCQSHHEAASPIGQLTVKVLDWLRPHLDLATATIEQLIYGDEDQDDEKHIATFAAIDPRIMPAISLGLRLAKQHYDAKIYGLSHGERIGAENWDGAKQVVHNFAERVEQAIQAIPEASRQELVILLGEQHNGGIGAAFNPLVMAVAQQYGCHKLVAEAREEGLQEIAALPIDMLQEQFIKDEARMAGACLSDFDKDILHLHSSHGGNIASLQYARAQGFYLIAGDTARPAESHFATSQQKREYLIGLLMDGMIDKRNEDLAYHTRVELHDSKGPVIEYGGVFHLPGISARLRDYPQLVINSAHPMFAHMVSSYVQNEIDAYKDFLASHSVIYAIEPGDTRFDFVALPAHEALKMAEEVIAERRG
jgi:hypothetical protein